MRKLRLLGLLVAGFIAFALLRFAGSDLDRQSQRLQRTHRTTSQDKHRTGVDPAGRHQAFGVPVDRPRTRTDESWQSGGIWQRSRFCRCKGPRCGCGCCRCCTRSLQIGRIEIDGLDLRLKKNAAGKGNWEDFGQKQASASVPETGQAFRIPRGIGLESKSRTAASATRRSRSPI